jgi:glycosyltransferase involved in cell wall biosynthesis
MHVGIAHPSILEGDAIGTDVRGMAYYLGLLGYQATLYTAAANVADSVQAFADIGDLDVYIYHHSIHWVPGVQYLLDFPGRKIVKYHNITPPHFFEDDEDTRLGCEGGLAQLAEILACPCELWADSTYNGEQLAALRPGPYTVIPPFHQVDSLMSAEADGALAAKLSDGTTNLMLVGRVVPNKDQMAAVEAFVAYRALNPASRLIFVGNNTGPYADAVANRVLELGLRGRVIMAGTMSRGQLKALYQVADALLVTSRHEGFCVPVVEAMAFGVPVVSRSDAALAETGAGVARFCDGSPEEWAIAIWATLANRDEHVRAGREKYLSRYQNCQIAEVLRAAMDAKG